MAELDGFQQLCKSDLLVNGGKGYRFVVDWEDGHAPAFVLRFNDTVYGYLNRCAHQAIELDWNPGEFFDNDQRFLVCTTHGALYDPQTGSCISGRCNGRGLTRLDVMEVDETIYVRSNEVLIPNRQIGAQPDRS